MYKRFIIYGTLGWALEIFWTGMSSLFSGDMQLYGYTYIWMFPVYGLAVALEPLHYNIRTLPWYIRGLIWAISIFIIEYTTGWLFRILLGSCPWDYSSSPFNIDGVIRLDFFPAWFIVGLLFERVHDKLEQINI